MAASDRPPSYFQPNHLPNPPQVQMIVQKVSEVIKILGARVVSVRRQRREAFVFTQPVEIRLPPDVTNIKR